MRKVFLILLVLIFSASSANAQSGKKCSASGKLIDDNGNPVTKALVYTDLYHQDDVDVIIVAQLLDENGIFYAASNCPHGTGYLWISPAFDKKEIFVPVEPPFFRFAGKHRRYGILAGIPFKGSGIQLGEIKIPIPYRKIWLTLQNEAGAALFSNPAEWENIFFTVKNELGLDVTSSASPFAAQLKNENSVRDSSILMSLPEGRWIVEIKPRKGKRLFPDKMIEVRNSGVEIQEVNLRLSRKKFRR